MKSFVFVGKLTLLFSGLLVVASVVCMVVFGLRFGIDFTGGSLFEFGFESRPMVDDIRAIFSEYDISEVTIQTLEDNAFVIRTTAVDSAQYELILASIQEQFPDVEELRFETVGPTFGVELRNNSIWALILVAIAIVLYIAYAFRKLSSPLSSWKFGIAAIVALIHDVVIAVGFFALLGHLYGVQLDTLFVTAMLTILGYSVNDTIVIFDRIRENAFRQPELSSLQLISRSVRDSLTRSINTSATTVFVLLALFLFGGHSIQFFVLALLFGVVLGTYSSLFVASPILAFWQKRA
jgi:preprotein translocase subunit SecF